ncbi:MAG TPA: hypothetical protein VMP67_08220 [Candidatus Limnocylindria bacterium]|nr:hypothetical protein [Candidatus Limnocylindria bacterium]
MKRVARTMLVGLMVAALAACGPAGQQGPEGIPTGPDLQTPVPNAPGDPPPAVLPMPPQEPGTMPPGDEDGPETIIPTVQP